MIRLKSILQALVGLFLLSLLSHQALKSSNLAYAESSGQSSLPPVGYFHALAHLLTGDLNEDLKNIETVSRFAYLQSTNEIFVRTLHEVSHVDHLQRDKKRLILKALFRALGRLATHNDLKRLDEVLHAALSQDELRANKDFVTEIQNAISAIKREAALRSQALGDAFEQFPKGDFNNLLISSTPIETPAHRSVRLLQNASLSTESNSSPLSPPPFDPEHIFVSDEKEELNPDQALNYQEWLEDSLSALDEKDIRQMVVPLKYAPFMKTRLIELETQRLRSLLTNEIIGQPEAVESLVALSREDLMLGTQGRQKPKIRVIMGMPNSGEEDLAKSYINIKHSDSNAHNSHLFTISPIKNWAQLNTLTGSQSGLVDSDHVSEFYRFLVRHSGGKYLVEHVPAVPTPYERIILNPNYTIQNSVSYDQRPMNAVVYIQDFHLTSKAIKDSFWKPALQEGRFKIQNAQGGVHEIIVPVTFVISTREGMQLLSSREVNGQRFGAPLSFEQSLTKWEHVFAQPELLKNEMLRTTQVGNLTEEAPGNSEEFLRLFSADDLVLLRPRSPEDLKRVARRELEKMSDELLSLQSSFGPFGLVWTNELIEFLSSYRYNAEENAGPIKQRVNDMVKRTLLSVLGTPQLPAQLSHRELTVSIVRMDSGQYALKINDLLVPIESTRKDIYPQALTDKEIDEVLGMEESLNSRVFGIQKIAHDLTRSRLDNEEIRRIETPDHLAKLSADIVMFLGLSSTGKTETAKVAVELETGTNQNLTTIDFSQVRTVEDLKVRILGKIENGQPVASEFMKAYDRLNGRARFVFDEFANAPADVLKALYDIFREPLVTTFSDGRARQMRDVKIYITGNAGEEWFKSIPRNVPEVQQRSAMTTTYQRILQNPGMRRSLLETYFSGALLNRIGEKRIYFFGPLGYKESRSLSELRLGQVLDGLEPQPGRRGWYLRFATEEHYSQLLDLIEETGFILLEQGASIDRFIMQDLRRALRTTLLERKIPDLSTLSVVPSATTVQRDGVTYKAILLTLTNQKDPSQQVTVQIEGKQQEVQQKRSIKDIVLTAGHEVGHEIVNRVYFSEFIDSSSLSVIPGLTLIGGKWINYYGLSSTKNHSGFEFTQEVVLREMAMLLGGDAAERIMTKGHRHHAGKSNDFMRATDFAFRSLFKFGLNQSLGLQTYPPEMSVQTILATLSNERRLAVENEVNRMLLVAKELAERAILNNMGQFVSLTEQLASQGKMSAEQLKLFYQQKPLLVEADGNLTFAKLKAIRSPETSLKPHAELQDFIKMPTSVVTPEQVAQQERRLALQNYRYLNKVEKYLIAQPTNACDSLLNESVDSAIKEK